MQKIITIPTTENYSVWYNKETYIDKTNIIVDLKGTLEKGSALFFARPRRWGKSLFLSTVKHFFDETLYKEEYFIDKFVWQEKDLVKRAGTFFTLSLDLKPLFERETKKLDYNKLWIQIFEQIPNQFFQNYLEKYFGITKFLSFDEKILFFEEKNIIVGDFIKKFVEIYSKEKDIFLFIDEYDKPINDCLKNQKNEMCCKEILLDLKDSLYRYFKDIPCIILITGINKLSMSSFFSDFNNLTDYSYLINVGFTGEETKSLFEKLGIDFHSDIKKWYNGYKFTPFFEEYNPWAIMKYLEKGELESYWSKTGTSPEYFRYLIFDVLKIKDFEDFLELLKTVKYQDEIINLEFINEKNITVILHYFYYAGLLTFTEEKLFAIPNNDVIFSYKNLIFSNTQTEFYLNLRNISIDGFLYLKKDSEYFKKFIHYLLNEKYVNYDKRKLGEFVIVSDIFLIMKTFIRIDIRREVNLLSGRSDIEYIDHENEHILLEFKVIKKSKDFETKQKEGKEQIEKYKNSGKYQKLFLIIIDLQKNEVEIF